MNVVLAGGSGSLGQRLADDLAARGFAVVILTRAPRDASRHREVRWDGRTIGPWAGELAGSILINLAGELVDRRPTPANVDLLRRSRVEPTRALVEASGTQERAPVLWLQMSTLAIYGDAGEAEVDETHPPAAGPPQMAGVARAWEAALVGAVADRTVVLRTGLVLDLGTPVVNRLARLTRWGLGGRIGPGDQWVSWIHMHDFLRAVRFLVDDATLAGVVHVTSPNPIRNRDMMRALRTAFRRPWSPPTPTPLVHVGAARMRSAPALALTGRRCVPARLLERGFGFDEPDFAHALGDLVRRDG
jgi:uncharacterized protein (TIGR01777 family)